MKKYFTFKGRIRRTTYFLRCLFICIPSFIYGFLVGLSAYVPPIILLALPFLVLTVWLSLAANAQRCHDMDKSGWYSLIPIYGPIICLFVEGTHGPNQYGDDPKQLSMPAYVPPPTQPKVQAGQTPGASYQRGVYVDVENDPNQVTNQNYNQGYIQDPPPYQQPQFQQPQFQQPQYQPPQYQQPQPPDQQNNGPQSGGYRKGSYNK